MRPPRLSVLVSALALVLAALTVATGSASAEPDQSLVAATSPMGQTNGRVWSMVYADGVLYAGGEFTSTRPAGAAQGTGEVARGRFAAFSAQTGKLLPLAHTFDDAVRGMALSPDRKTLYVVGRFRTVDGQARGRGAA